MSGSNISLHQTNSLGILYSFRRCPYAMRARLACALFLPTKCLELREVVLKNKPQELLNISPKATVPVLYLNSEQIIDESRDIALWALEQSSDEVKKHYLPFHLQLNIEELIDENDGTFKLALDHYKYADRFEESEEYYRTLGEQFLIKLECLLEKNQYLFTAEISYADIAIFPFVRQFAHVNMAWFEKSSYPKLIHWLRNLLDSEIFKSIMEKHDAWEVGNDITLFPK